MWIRPLSIWPSIHQSFSMSHMASACCRAFMGLLCFFLPPLPLCSYLAILSPDSGFLVGQTLGPFCGCYPYIGITTGWWKDSMLCEQSHSQNIFAKRKEVYEAFSRGKCPHQRQVRLFHLCCCPLLLSPIWRTAFKSSRDSLAQCLSCLFFF